MPRANRTPPQRGVSKADIERVETLLTAARSYWHEAIHEEERAHFIRELERLLAVLRAATLTRGAGPPSPVPTDEELRRHLDDAADEFAARVDEYKATLRERDPERKKVYELQQALRSWKVPGA